jgi:hypothetical protein
MGNRLLPSPTGRLRAGNPASDQVLVVPAPTAPGLLYLPPRGWRSEGRFHFFWVTREEDRQDAVGNETRWLQRSGEARWWTP